MRKFTLLLVDDNEPVVRAIERGIGGTMEVITATGPASAKLILRNRAVDVIATDFMMIGGTGLELLQWARDNKPNVGRVLFTGVPDTALQPFVSSGLAHGILAKPFLIIDLMAVLTRVIALPKPELMAD
ncbi:MAG: response regulator [Deltaproteobacteria bacterium]|nr:response regulator [Deltaproteobacteria bacterium]